MRKHDVILINSYYAFSETTLGKSGPWRAASTLLICIGFRCRVSGVSI